MKLFMALLAIFSCAAMAETLRLNHKVSSAAQDVAYLTEQLRAVLEPGGYELDPETIDLTDLVYHPASTRPIIIETPKYAVQGFHFDAHKNGQLYTGHAYLLSFRHDRSQPDEWEFNSSARRYHSRTWKTDCTLLLTKEYLTSYFPIEVRVSDLNLRVPGTF